MSQSQSDKDSIAKVIDDLLMMRREEARGVMVMANSDDTMFEDCIRRLRAFVPECGTINAAGEVPARSADLAKSDLMRQRSGPLPAAPAEGPTPRTDAIIKAFPASAGLSELALCCNQLSDHARQLERELAVAKKWLDAELSKPVSARQPPEVAWWQHAIGTIEICNHSNVIARMMVDGTQGLITARRIVLSVNATEKNIARRNSYERTGRYSDKPIVRSATGTMSK